MYYVICWGVEKNVKYGDCINFASSCILLMILFEELILSREKHNYIIGGGK